MKFSLQQLNWPNYFPSQDSISMIIHTFILAVNYLFKAFTHFCFHFDWNIISHNLNDQVCAIIIAHHKMDDQICAIERVDIYRQSLIPTHIPISRTFRISQITFYTRTIGNYIEIETNLQLKPDNVLCTLLHIISAIQSSSGCLNRTGIYE